MPPDRWFAVGTADVSADGAGGRAADAALIHDEAKLLIVFCSPTENVPDLIGQIRSRSGDVPLIGCTTAGEIARNGPRDGSVVVAALGGDGFVIGTAAAAGASEDLRDAGARAAGCMPSPAGHPHRVMLLPLMAWPATRTRSSAARIRFSAPGSRWSAAARATG